MSSRPVSVAQAYTLLTKTGFCPSWAHQKSLIKHIALVSITFNNTIHIIIFLYFVHIIVSNCFSGNIPTVIPDEEVGLVDVPLTRIPPRLPEDPEIEYVDYNYEKEIDDYDTSCIDQEQTPNCAATSETPTFVSIQKRAKAMHKSSEYQHNFSPIPTLFLQGGPAISANQPPSGNSSACCYSTSHISKPPKANKCNALNVTQITCILTDCFSFSSLPTNMS